MAGTTPVGSGVPEPQSPKDYDKMTKAELITEIKKQNIMAQQINEHFLRMDREKYIRVRALGRFHEAFHAAMESKVIFHQEQESFTDGLKQAITLFDASFPA